MLLSIMNSRKKTRGQNEFHPRNFRNDVIRRMETAGRSVDLPEVWKTQVGRWKWPAVREACNPQMFTAELHLNPKFSWVGGGWWMVGRWWLIFLRKKFKVIFGGFQPLSFQGYLQLHLNRLMHSKMCSCHKNEWTDEQMGTPSPIEPFHEATMSFV